MDESPAPSLCAELAAQQPRKWAQKNRIVANAQVEPEFDEGLVQSILSPVGVRATTSEATKSRLGCQHGIIMQRIHIAGDCRE